MERSDEEVRDYNAAASQRARERTPLSDHFGELLTPPEADAGGEVEEVEGEDDFGRYEIPLPPKAVEEPDRRFHWSETKKALPCADEFEAALLSILKEISNPESTLTPLEKLEALTGIYKFQAMVLIATIKARA